jgi:hypothetical protein
VMGAGFLGFAITSLFGYMASTWEEVRIVVLGEIVFTLLGMVSSLWMILVHATIPALWGWFNVLLMALFFVLFLYSYYISTR